MPNITTQGVLSRWLRSLSRGACAVALCAIPLLAPACGIKGNESDPNLVPDPMVRIRAAQDLADQAQKLDEQADVLRAQRVKLDEARALEVRALALCQQSIRTYDEFGPAWNNMGVIQMKLNNNQGAMDAFKRAAELLPTDPKPVANMGVLWQSLYYLDDAKKAYDQALALDNRYLPALKESVTIDLRRDMVTKTTAERVQQALLLETDQARRADLLRQKIAVEERLATKETAER